LAQASLTMRTSLLFAALAGAALRKREHPVEVAEAKMVRDGGGGHVTRACAAYFHEINAALALDPCSDRAVRALEAMAEALPHCEHETFGSTTGGDFATSYHGFQEEYQHRCVGLCDPECVHGTCTGLKQCTCQPQYHGPLCEFPVCEGGCGPGLCGEDFKCNCPATFTGEHCETSLTTTTSTTTSTTTTVMAYEKCAELAGAVITAANYEGVCDGEGAEAFTAFEAELPACKDYFIKGVDRNVGYLNIDDRYGDIYVGVHELKSKC